MGGPLIPFEALAEPDRQEVLAELLRRAKSEPYDLPQSPATLRDLRVSFRTRSYTTLAKRSTASTGRAW